MVTITVKELKTVLAKLDASMDNKIVSAVSSGFEGVYLVLEDKLHCREGRITIQAK